MEKELTLQKPFGRDPGRKHLPVRGCQTAGDKPKAVGV